MHRHTRHSELYEHILQAEAEARFWGGKRMAVSEAGAQIPEGRVVHGGERVGDFIIGLIAKQWSSQISRRGVAERTPCEPAHEAHLLEKSPSTAREVCVWL
jgi:hypothetical protein